jgi:hypothetical protein
MIRDRPGPVPIRARWARSLEYQGSRVISRLPEKA